MIYQRLKMLRKKHGETLEQWEKLTGISKSAISRIENGKQSGTFEELGIFLEKVARNQEEKDFLIYGKTPKRDKKEESSYTTYLEQQLQKANDDIIWLKRVVELQAGRKGAGTITGNEVEKKKYPVTVPPPRV